MLLRVAVWCPLADTDTSADQIIVSWVANSFPRPMVKRSICIALANMIGNTASIYGSYMYPSSASPRYIPGGVTNTVVCVVVAAMAMLLRWIHIRENKKLEALESEDGLDVQAGAGHGSGGVAGGRRVTGFRYVY